MVEDRPCGRVCAILPYDNDLGFTIAIADTSSAIDMFQELENAGQGGALAISFTGDLGSFEEPGTGETIDQLLANTTFMESKAYSQRMIDANLKVLLEEISLNPEDVIRVPTLFRAATFSLELGIDGLLPNTKPIFYGEKSRVALWPASIEGIVIGNNYFSPKP
jgi:protein-arginine deiminase